MVSNTLSQIILCLSIPAWAGLAHAAVDASLIGWWKFDDGSGSTIAVDAGGNGNDGTLVNMDPSADWVAGEVGSGALDFDGIDDYVDCGNAAVFDVTNALTVSAWVRPADVTSYQMIVSKRYGAFVNVPFDLHLSNNNARMLIHDGTNNNAAQSLGGITADNWHHVAAVYDGTTMTVYANGIPGTPVARTDPLPINTRPVIIGRRADGAFDHFAGAIDDVRIYNRALSAAEIMALSQQEEPGDFVTLTLNVTPGGPDTVSPPVGLHAYPTGAIATLNASRYVSCPDVLVFDHWEGAVADPGSAATTILMDANEVVTAVFVDGSECDDECHPIPQADLTGNCVIDAEDVSLLAQQWIESTLLTPPVPDDLTPFTLVVLPDTQYYSASYPNIFTSQTQWIKDNKEALNIVFVLHEGDLVNTVTVDMEWQRANTSISILDGFVPYTLAAGNHDMDHHGDGFRDIETTQRDSTKYNQYFSYTRYEAEPWYGGHLGSDNDNHYVFFSAAGMDFMIITMEAWPTSAMLTWANQMVSAHSDSG